MGSLWVLLKLGGWSFANVWEAGAILRSEADSPAFNCSVHWGEEVLFLLQACGHRPSWGLQDGELSQPGRLTLRKGPPFGCLLPAPRAVTSYRDVEDLVSPSPPLLGALRGRLLPCRTSVHSGTWTRGRSCPLSLKCKTMTSLHRPGRVRGSPAQTSPGWGPSGTELGAFRVVLWALQVPSGMDRRGGHPMASMEVPRGSGRTVSLFLSVGINSGCQWPECWAELETFLIPGVCLFKELHGVWLPGFR